MMEIPTGCEGAWGAEEATAQDVIIPKLLLMHGQSEKVLAGDKGQGELVRSTDWTTLAKRNETINVVPFKMTKTWKISEIIDGKPKWKGEEAWTLDNSQSPWEYEVNGKLMRRDLSYNFYAIIPSEVTEVNPTPFPIRMQFIRTSAKAGKILANHFSTSKMLKRPPALVTFDIGSEFVNGDKNKYFVFTAKLAKASTKEQLVACKFWYDMINTSTNIKDHDVEDVAEVATAGVEEF